MVTQQVGITFDCTQDHAGHADSALDSVMIVDRIVTTASLLGTRCQERL
jgi:hypothetical protein